MDVQRIDTTVAGWRDDPRLADYRIVRDPELVRRSDAFLAEGRLVVRALLAAPAFETRSVLTTEVALEWLRANVEEARADVPVYILPPEGLREMSGYQFHQGCLASGRRPPAVAVSDLLAAHRPRCVLAMDEVSNPDNVGAMFRTAAAFGVEAVVLSPGCASPLYRKALRTSMGQALALPFSHGPAWPEGLAALAQAGYALLALTPDDHANSIDTVADQLPAEQPRALIVGAEGAGLGSASLAAANHTVRIPMVTGMDSLNVAAATAVALYRFAPTTPRR